MNIHWTALLALTLASTATSAELEVISLPPFQLNGQPARAHTQGMEAVGPHFYVTARVDFPLPKRPLLLRTEAHGSHWDVWDIAPASSESAAAKLDHPGGMQSDGKRLWIPVAQSVRHGRSVIRVFSLANLVPGRAATSDFEFEVADHIGAIAVAPGQQRVFGASWDTETVYVWNFQGRLQRTLDGPDLVSRKLGAVPSAGGHAGIAVQDWKVVDDRLFASGLFTDPHSVPPPPRSRLLIFQSFLEPAFECQTIQLPLRERTELAQEAMAVSGGSVYFLPEDLGASNRVFRTSLEMGRQ